MFGRFAFACALFSTIGTTSAYSQPVRPDAKPSRKVLVELYTSQGCNSCPSANDLLGQLERLGYGPERIVPIAFHVDYFNQPWADPFSSHDFSRRELAYNSVLKREDLYFTPMMMIDGRTPMLGSNRVEAITAIKKSLAEPPGASLKLSLDDRKTADRLLTVEIAPLLVEIQGRQIMVGVTVTEGPISTRVLSGENSGKTLVEPFVVRSFTYKTTKLNGADSIKLTFPIKLAEGSLAGRCRVSAFIQDWDNGRVYQAESIRWVAETLSKK